MELTYVLNEILKKEKKLSKEEPTEVSAVFVSVLTKDGYLRCIPWSEENTIIDHINLLANGLLEDVTIIELAKNLVELKCQDYKTFKDVYRSMQENTEFDNYEELENTMADIIQDLDLEEHVMSNSEEDEMIC